GGVILGRLLFESHREHDFPAATADLLVEGTEVTEILPLVLVLVLGRRLDEPGRNVGRTHRSVREVERIEGIDEEANLPAVRCLDRMLVDASGEAFETVPVPRPPLLHEA